MRAVQFNRTGVPEVLQLVDVAEPALDDQRITRHDGPVRAASGAVPPIDPTQLARAGSVSLLRPRLAEFIPTRADLEARLADLVRWLGDGRLEVSIAGRFPLAQAADAHRALENRATTGKLILLPQI